MWLKKAFLSINQVYIVFNIVLWGNSFEFLKDVTIVTIFTVIQRIQNQ